MILTDREWLRFVTFSLVAGAILGALNTGALVLAGREPLGAMAGAVIGLGVLGLLFHATVRYVLDRASEPPTTEDTEEAETA